MSRLSELSTTEAASHGVRRVALSLMADVQDERARLRVPGDIEALHDFRVAVRRLRSWMRMMDGDLEGSHPRRVRQALREYGQRSNAGRDAEVLREWLAATTGELMPRHRPAARWLMRQQDARHLTADRELHVALDGTFDAVMQKLERRLRRFRTVVHLDTERAEPSLAARVAERARAQGAVLRHALERVQDVEDDAAIHEARIAGKRLRYLLEPLVASHPAFQSLIDRLKGLQDALGAVHDAHVWGAALHRTLQQAADEEGRSLQRVATGAAAQRGRSALPSRSGLMALAGKMHDHAARQFDVYRADWVEGGGAQFQNDLEQAALALMAESRPLPVEIERKYLLKGVPRRMPRGRVSELHQGYLPGDQIIERVRKSTRGRQTAYTRTIKFGAGVVRTEVEEPITRVFFEQVWPLTEGKRVLKRRHAVRHGGHTWEIDVFSDRALVLAEVELSAADERPAFPPWLVRYVVRDVTGEPEYLNLRLAR
ncbi:MAG: CHAD domain-containing protein [Gemmatimonadaceae bacterium]